MLLGLLLIALAILGRALPAGAWLAALVERLRGAGLVGAILFSCAYTPGAFLFVPSALFSFAAGFAYAFSRP